MLSNAYFLAKFRFDTAVNEPAKNLQILQNLPILPLLPLTLTPNRRASAAGTRPRGSRARPRTSARPRTTSPWARTAGASTTFGAAFSLPRLCMGQWAKVSKRWSTLTNFWTARSRLYRSRSLRITIHFEKIGQLSGNSEC